ncbi:MAG TPA: hypothetical protein DEF42_13310 [Desulfosporosinus sp.]|nr:hypothetical protein [Desulfosporosinus sp.]
MAVRLMYRLKDYAKEINRCIQCNFCLEHCPVYIEDGLESSVARGRLNLIQALLLEKTLILSDRAGVLLNRCLLCTNCTQGCPSGIPVDDIVITARVELQKNYGLGRGKSFLLRQVVNRSNTTNIATKALSLARRLNMVPEEFPEVVSPSFEQRVPSIVKPEGEIRGKVGYFIGCATNYLYPEIGDAVIKVLTALGYEVVIPANQHCCGIPALAHGELGAAQEAVRWNADLFSKLDVDAVITDCTSCGYMLKVKAAKTLENNDPCQSKVASVAEKVVEITEFVTREGLGHNFKLILGKSKDLERMDVTYHVPCHRAWSPNLIQAPRKLISMLPAVSLAEMNEPQRCCGAGGSFFVDHKDLAESILDRKLKNIQSTGAEAVMTQCPACRYYLRGGLEKKMPVFHPLELLAKAIHLV